MQLTPEVTGAIVGLTHVGVRTIMRVVDALERVSRSPHECGGTPLQKELIALPLTLLVSILVMILVAA